MSGRSTVGTYQRSWDDHGRRGAASLLLIRISAVLALALLAIGCDCGNRFCPANIVYGIQLRVMDSESGRDESCGATIWITDGAYVDSLRARDCDRPDSLRSGYVFGARERPGTYEVYVEKTGYRPWHMTNVSVVQERCDCHVRTKKIEARIQSLPGSQVIYF